MQKFLFLPLRTKPRFPASRLSHLSCSMQPSLAWCLLPSLYAPSCNSSVVWKKLSLRSPVTAASVQSACFNEIMRACIELGCPDPSPRRSKLRCHLQQPGRERSARSRQRYQGAMCCRTGAVTHCHRAVALQLGLELLLVVGLIPVFSS